MAPTEPRRKFTVKGLGRYLQFAQRYGIRRSVKYFFNTTWFDWRTGLDTAHSVPVADLRSSGTNRGDEVEYLPSWTGTVRKAFAVMHDLLGPHALNHTLIDVGAGKGKVCILWATELARAGLEGVKVRGVDISAKLCQIARRNVARAGLSRQVFIDESDALSLELAHNERVILWLYNPFGEATLARLLENSRGQVEAIVYCNPLAHKTVVAAGYEVKYEEKKWHPNLNFILYTPRDRPGSDF